MNLLKQLYHDVTARELSAESWAVLLTITMIALVIAHYNF